ncbi:MAG: HU family DNA-binding protein [Prevotella sp.]|nr:HU family DNA-binding protein [Candidatus Prevotella equi]
MAIQYITRQDTRRGSAKLWYGRAVHPSTVNLDKLADRIQRQCSMTKGDVLAVLTELVTVMKDELQNSNKVKLDGLGTFAIGIKTVGASTEEEFNVQEYVKAFRVNFCAEGHKQHGGKIMRTFCDNLLLKKAVGASKTGKSVTP